FLHNWPLALQALAGALAGSGSYAAGLYFGAVRFGLPLPQTLLLLALLWAVLLPLQLQAASGKLTWPRSVPALLCGLLLAWTPPARSAPEPAELQLIGQASFRYLFWQVYDATLHAADNEFRF